jgi:hypothetical protein
MQAYVPAAGETCGQMAPAWVNWPGIANQQNQGWSASWQQWPNGGTGGMVCVRQPFYTTSGTWSAG